MTALPTRLAPAFRSLGRSTALDGIRAVAMLAVFLTHSNLRRFFPGGFLGVQVFFVLSGFLITSLLLEQWHRDSRVSLRSFYLHRFVRLVPAAAFLFAGLLVMSLLFYDNGNAFMYNVSPQAVGRAAVSSFGGFMNWQFAWPFDHVQGQSLVIGRGLNHLWSLSVEQQFYLMWPLLLIVLLRRNTSTPALVAVIGVLATVSALSFLWLPLSWPDRLYFGTDFEAHGLLLGCLAAVLFSRGVISQSTVRQPLFRLVMALGIVAAVAMLVDAHRWYAYVYTGGIQLLSLATAMVILTVALQPGLLSSLLSNRVLVYLGKRSYALYLWSQPIQVWTLDLPMGLHLLVSAAGALLMAELSWRLVEQPAVRWRRNSDAASRPLEAPAATAPEARAA